MALIRSEQLKISGSDILLGNPSSGVYNIALLVPSMSIADAFNVVAISSSFWSGSFDGSISRNSDVKVSGSFYVSSSIDVAGNVDAESISVANNNIVTSILHSGKMENFAGNTGLGQSKPVYFNISQSNAITGTRTSDTVFTRTDVPTEWSGSALVGQFAFSYNGSVTNTGSWDEITANDSSSLTINGVLYVSADRVKTSVWNPIDATYPHGQGDGAFSDGVFDGESIWLVPYLSSDLVKLDPSTGTMTSYPHGKGALAFYGGVFDGENIWLVPYFSSELVKVDPSTGEMTSYAHGKGNGAFGGGVFDGNNIWLVPGLSSDLVKVNLSTGEMTSYPHGKGAGAFTGGVFDGESIWLVPSNSTDLVKVNPFTGVMTSYAHGKGSSAFIGGVFDGESIWLVPYDSDDLVKVNPSTGVMTSYAHGKGDSAFFGGVFDGESIWLVPHSSTDLVKVNPVTGVMTSYAQGKGSFAFSGGVFDGENIWLVPQNSPEIVKIRPPRFGRNRKLINQGRSEITFASGENPTEAMRISSSGYVGIGTTYPEEQLHVWNNVSASAFYGDGSGITGVISSSYAVSASYEIIKEVSSSYANYATSASAAEFGVTSSYAEFATSASWAENAYWTSSDGYISRESDVKVSGSFYVSQSSYAETNFILGSVEVTSSINTHLNKNFLLFGRNKNHSNVISPFYTSEVTASLVMLDGGSDWKSSTPLTGNISASNINSSIILQYGKGTIRNVMGSVVMGYGNEVYGLTEGGFVCGDINTLVNLANTVNQTVFIAGSSNKIYDSSVMMVFSDSTIVSGSYAGVVIGGYNHILNDTNFGSILSGHSNQISGSSDYSTIVGGELNKIGGTSQNNVIIGAYGGQIDGSSYGVVIVGGINNTIAGGIDGVILGGQNNNVTDVYPDTFLIAGKFIEIGSSENTFVIGAGNATATKLVNNNDNSIWLGFRPTSAVNRYGIFIENSGQDTQITSSVNISGSLEVVGPTIFGDSANDIHQFTGSVYVSSSIDVAGNVEVESISVANNNIITSVIHSGKRENFAGNTGFGQSKPVYFNISQSNAISGSRTSATVFTRTDVPTEWSGSALSGSALVGQFAYSYLSSVANTGSWDEIVSNDSSSLTINGTLHASADRIKTLVWNPIDAVYAHGKGGNAFYGGVFDGESVWLVPFNSDDVVKVNPSTGEMTSYAHGKGGTAFVGGVFDGENIWLVPDGSSDLVKVNPSTGAMTSYAHGKDVSAFWGGVFDGESIWLVPRNSDDLVKINPSTGEMTSYPHGKGNTAFFGGVFDGENIWLVPYSSTDLVKVNPSTGAMTSYAHGKGSQAFRGGVFDGENIWLVPYISSDLVKVNPSTGEMTSYAHGKSAGAFSGGVFDGESVWLVPFVSGELVKVNPSTGEMISYDHGKGNQPFVGGVFDGENIWLVPNTSKDLVKVHPPRFGQNRKLISQGKTEIIFASGDNPTEAMRISSSGYVGIGITTPKEQLHVWNNVSASAFYGNGANLTGISDAGLWTGSDEYISRESNVQITGSLDVSETASATYFVGDGSGIIGVISASYAVSASYEIIKEVSSSHANFATSASHAELSDNTTSASFADFTTSASHAELSDDATSASFADFTTSASHAELSDDATSASFADFTTSASYAVNFDEFWTGSDGYISRKGDVQVTGSFYATGSVSCDTLLARSKYFDIEHPVYPDKRLRHASVETNKHDVYYRGVLKFNEIEYEKIIPVPYYFGNLVHEDSITIQLTSIGDFNDYYYKIYNNKVLTVRRKENDRPTRVSWIVYATRKDVSLLVEEI